jgi:hypothetical protein
MKPKLTLMAALLMLSGCGDVLFLEGAVNQLCQKLPAQRFRVPQRAETTVPTSVTLERRFDFDVTAQLPAEMKRAELIVALEQLTLSSAQGLTDLRLIDTARVTLEPPPATRLAPKVVLEAEAPTRQLVRFNGEELELSPYLQAGVLSYTVALTASSMPGGELSADVDACANVSVKWHYAQ